MEGNSHELFEPFAGSESYGPATMISFSRGSENTFLLTQVIPELSLKKIG
jgi:hypothetical protein